MNSWIDLAIGHALRRLNGIQAEVSDFPHITEKGSWRTTPDGVWTGGFWAGLLWLAHSLGNDRTYLDAAVHYTDRLLPRASDRQNHDLGFMFYPSAIRAWELTGEDRYRDAALDAAESLAGQFNQTAGFIPGWGFFGGSDWSGSVLVDTLMNLPLMVWAVGQGASASMLEVVRQHARTSIAFHLRTNGSVFHMYRFDPGDGRPLGGATYQGLSADSAWARGQAWALTGLAILACVTREPLYLGSSRRVAAYFMGQLTDELIPPWDFAVTDRSAPRDSSAGAIAAYGLLKLHQCTGDSTFLDQSRRLLQAIAERCGNRSGRGGLLLHATADLPHGLGIDESTMYGDYYYLKSLCALKARAG